MKNFYLGDTFKQFNHDGLYRLAGLRKVNEQRCDIVLEVVPAIAASFMWSLVPAFISRWGRDAPPMLFTFFRAISALAFLLIVLEPVKMVMKFNTYVNNFNVDVLLLLVLSGIIGPGLGDAAYTRSIQLLGGSLAITVSYTYIILVQIFTSLLHVEALTIGTVLGASISLLGVCVAVLTKPAKINFIGIAFSLIASTCWALAITIVKMLQPYIDSLQLTMGRIASAALAMIVMSLAKGEVGRINKNNLLAAVITGIVGWGIGMTLYMYSIYAIGPSRASIATALTPILTQFTSRLIAREKPSYRTVIGSALVAIGIFISTEVE